MTIIYIKVSYLMILDFKNNIENHEEHTTKIACKNVEFHKISTWHKKILFSFFSVWFVYGM